PLVAPLRAFAPISSLSMVLPLFWPASPTTELYALSLHDALPILGQLVDDRVGALTGLDHDDRRARLLQRRHEVFDLLGGDETRRSEEHTSELQSRENLVCRLLLEKKKPAPRGYAKSGVTDPLPPV